MNYRHRIALKIDHRRGLHRILAFVPFLVADIQQRVVTNAHSHLKEVSLYLKTDPPSAYNVTSLVKSKRLNYPHNCLYLDLAEDIKGKGLEAIGISFAFHSFTSVGEEEASAEIVVEERQRMLYRDDMENKKNFRGPIIENKIGKDETKRMNKFMLSLEQDIYVEEDKAIGCKKYDITSFNDCDEDAMQNWVVNKHDFLPFFMAKEQTNSTAGPIEVDFNCSLWKEEYAMFLGYRRSSCPIPCTKTIIDVKHLATEEAYDHTIIFMFSESLMVTTHSFPDMSLVEDLASVGGSMGLWLGLGVLQLLQLVVKNLFAVCTRVTKTTGQVDIEA